jgi:hypothetical protein
MRMNLPAPEPAAPVSLRGTRAGGRIRVLETWFDEDPESLAGVDVWMAYRRSRPVSEAGWQYFYTLRNDLRAAPEQLLAGMRKSTARGVKLAMGALGFRCEFNDAPSPADLAEYADFHDANPLRPGQAPVDRERLRALGATGSLCLARTVDPDGAPLIRRVLQRFPVSGVVQPILQASTYQNDADGTRGQALGNANRLLYYQEFLHFRELGLRTYDHNGWYSGLEDEKRLAINQFKESFGGEVGYGYDCEEPASLRGRMFLALQALRRRLLQPERQRDWCRRRRKAPSRPEL